MSRPTIQDVARMAGVSIATVSRCLHTPELVAESTRDRVLSAVRQTGYTLNAAAQSLRHRRSNTVLVVVTDIGNTFYSEILGGIQQVASNAGLTILIGDTGRIRAREDGYIRYLLNGRADGAVLLTDPKANWFDIPLTNARGILPVVVMSDVGADCASVTIDNVAAAQAAVQHLIDMGHRRIAYVTGPDADILTHQRLAGYQNALAAAGLPQRDDWILPGNFGLNSGRRAFDRFAQLAERPTAVFFANDESAMGFISSAHLAGVHVPNDVSVMGFDDIHFAQTCIPALSTIRQPRAEMGAAAMRLLLDIIAGKAPASVCMPFELIPRASTAPVAS